MELGTAEFFAFIMFGIRTGQKWVHNDDSEIVLMVTNGTPVNFYVKTYYITEDFYGQIDVHSLLVMYKKVG